MLLTSYTTLIITGSALITFFALLGLFLVYMERKMAAFMQKRVGPMRVGPYGTVQTIADALKLLGKEQFIPDGADRMLFRMAPFMAVVACMLAFAPIPFSEALQIWDINVGALYIPAVMSLGAVAMITAGWASNSKYPLLGAMRSGAQILSYELSLGFSLIAIVTFAGTLSLQEIVYSQSDGWWLFKGHIPAIIAFVIFIISATAELKRVPFDLAEAESELTAGYHTEYSGMRFALFFLAEYVNIFIMSALAATLFLGGWMPLQIGNWEAFNEIMAYIPPLLWFAIKTFLLVFLIMWFKWTFPRLRIDQLLKLEWKYLLPISMANILLVAIICLLGWHF